MTTRVMYNGHQIYASPGTKRPATVVTPAEAAKDIVPSAPIPPDSPLRASYKGLPWHDPKENITYRVVDRLNIQGEGWGTAAFWLARWKCTYADLLDFVANGWLDAALERGSPTKRYRCRDEAKILQALKTSSTKTASTRTSRKRSTTQRRTRAF